MTNAPSLAQLLTRKISAAIYRVDALPGHTLAHLALHHGWHLATLDGNTIASQAEFLSHIATALHFPPYFGHNWDALDECLAYPEEPAGPTLLLFEHPARFAKADPDAFTIALAILADATEKRLDTAYPLAVLFQGALPAGVDIPLLSA